MPSSETTKVVVKTTPATIEPNTAVEAVTVANPPATPIVPGLATQAAIERLLADTAPTDPALVSTGPVNITTDTAIPASPLVKRGESALKPTPREALVRGKIMAGLTRDQAEEVIDAQAAHDLAVQAAPVATDADTITPAVRKTAKA